MSAEENKQLFRRLIEEVANQGKIAVVDELVTADVIEHEEIPGIPRTREGVKQAFTLFRTAFPDLQVTIEDMVAEGDTVVARETWRGTHHGAFMEIPPTGKQVQFAAMDIVRIANGKMVEHWGQTDSLGMLQQLGAIPQPEAATT
jgi:steroid delta-isomerase-like uncharacterized protein